MDKYSALFEPIAKSLGLEIVSIRGSAHDLLEISVAYEDFRPMDLDTLEEASRLFAQAVDHEISLDVHSSGAERVIDPARYHEMKGRYVRIVFVEEVQGSDYVEGFVSSSDDEGIGLSYRVLQAEKSIMIPYQNIKTLSLAVKI